MARWRDSTGELLFLLATRRSNVAKEACQDRYATLADRTLLSRSQGRTWPRPLRGSSFPGLAPSRISRTCLLRVRRRRTRTGFPPLGPTDAGRRHAAARGLSVTSTTV